MNRAALKACNVTRGTLLGDRIFAVREFRARMKGLIGTEDLKEGEGLWISPCKSIHSFGMRIEFDAVFLDSDEMVLGIYRYFGKNRISRAFPKARGVLELPPGMIDQTDTRVGDLVRLTPWQWRK